MCKRGLSLAIIVLFPFYCWTIHEYTRENTAFFFDIDDVMSIKHKPDWKLYAGLTWEIVGSQPCLAKLLLPWNGYPFYQKIKEETKKKAGSSNVIHALLGYLKDRGCGDLLCYHDRILELSLNPEPLKPMVDAAMSLKEQGYTVIAVTNQDVNQHATYYAKVFARYGVDLSNAFHAALAVKAYNSSCDSGQQYYVHTHGKGDRYPIYGACSDDGQKPNKSYFDAARALAQSLSSRNVLEHFIFTDDTRDNVVGAQEAGFKAHHLDWHGGSARKTMPAERTATISQWLAAIKSTYGIDCAPAECVAAAPKEPVLLTY